MYISPIESGHNSISTWANFFGFAWDARILWSIIVESVEHLIQQWYNLKSQITIGEEWDYSTVNVENIENEAISMSELLILRVQASLRVLHKRWSTIAFDDFFWQFQMQLSQDEKLDFWNGLYQDFDWFFPYIQDNGSPETRLLQSWFEYLARKEFMKKFGWKSGVILSWYSMPDNPMTPYISMRRNDISMIWANWKLLF